MSCVKSLFSKIISAMEASAQSRAERYVILRNPKNAADVEAFMRDWERNQNNRRWSENWRNES